MTAPVTVNTPAVSNGGLNKMTMLDRFRELEVQLAEIRKRVGEVGSKEENPILDEMDWLWRDATNAEREAVRVSPAPIPAQADRFVAHVAWIKTNREKYIGKWIVLDEHSQLVGAGDDLRLLIRQARDQNVKAPFVHFIDAPDPGTVEVGMLSEEGRETPQAS